MLEIILIKSKKTFSIMTKLLTYLSSSKMVKMFFPISEFLEGGYERIIGHENTVKTHTDCAEQSEQQ
jgi:hypothetical protein